MAVLAVCEEISPGEPFVFFLFIRIKSWFVFLAQFNLTWFSSLWFMCKEHVYDEEDRPRDGDVGQVEQV